MCTGVFKAQMLHFKNPAQHFADIPMVENQPKVKPAFQNHQTGKQKDVECVQVDGGPHEGSVHKEVQYWWTERN